MNDRSRLGAAFAAMLCVSLAHGQDADTKEIKIKRALSAAPTSVAKSAEVIDVDAKRNVKVLREGTNGFTCIAGHPGIVGDDPVCADAAGMQWMTDLMAHKPKPTNTHEDCSASTDSSATSRTRKCSIPSYVSSSATNGSPTASDPSSARSMFCAISAAKYTG